MNSIIRVPNTPHRQWRMSQPGGAKGLTEKQIAAAKAQRRKVALAGQRAKAQRREAARKAAREEPQQQLASAELRSQIALIERDFDFEPDNTTGWTARKALQYLTDLKAEITPAELAAVEILRDLDALAAKVA